MVARAFFVGFLGLMPFATAAHADRAVTAEEQSRIAAALQAQNCEGGAMKFDDEDNYFKVEDARCEDGRMYELKFDRSFAMLEKSAENNDDDESNDDDNEDEDDDDNNEDDDNDEDDD